MTSRDPPSYDFVDEHGKIEQNPQLLLLARVAAREIVFLQNKCRDLEAQLQRSESRANDLQLECARLRSSFPRFYQGENQTITKRKTFNLRDI